MITKTKRIIAISTVAASLTLGAGMFFASNNVETLRSKATGETINGSVTFNSSSARESLGSNRYSFAGQSSRGTLFYLISQNSNALGTDYICSFTDSKSESILFSDSSSGSSGFKFQNITSVFVTVDTNRSVLVYTTSVDGKSFSDGGTNLSATTSGATLNVSGARYLKIAPSSVLGTNVTSVTINYSCETDYEEPSSGLSGSYVCSSNSSYTLDFDNYKYICDFYGSTYEMVFSIDGNALSYVSGDNSDFGNGYRLFVESTSGQSNNTLVIVSDTQITITLYGMGSSSTKTFNKQ